MKAVEIREMILDDIKLKLNEISKELFNIRLQHAAGRLDNPMKISQLKKDMARIKTIIKEKSMEKRA
ncbi:MAG: 50S ribosomal protein L29 [Deltaproteobacteria bacterium]|nr:50S ribosomal protein L29 [Deltaproteobacteria bacterium]